MYKVTNTPSSSTPSTSSPSETHEGRRSASVLKARKPKRVKVTISPPRRSLSERLFKIREKRLHLSSKRDIPYIKELKQCLSDKRLYLIDLHITISAYFLSLLTPKQRQELEQALAMQRPGRDTTTLKCYDGLSKDETLIVPAGVHKLSADSPRSDFAGKLDLSKATDLREIELGNIAKGVTIVFPPQVKIIRTGNCSGTLDFQKVEHLEEFEMGGSFNDGGLREGGKIIAGYGSFKNIRLGEIAGILDVSKSTKIDFLSFRDLQKSGRVILCSEIKSIHAGVLKGKLDISKVNGLETFRINGTEKDVPLKIPAGVKNCILYFIKSKVYFSPDIVLQYLNIYENTEGELLTVPAYVGKLCIKQAAWSKLDLSKVKKVEELWVLGLEKGEVAKIPPSIVKVIAKPYILGTLDLSQSKATNVQIGDAYGSNNIDSSGKIIVGPDVKEINALAFSIEGTLDLTKAPQFKKRSFESALGFNGHVLR